MVLVNFQKAIDMVDHAVKLEPDNIEARNFADFLHKKFEEHNGKPILNP